MRILLAIALVTLFGIVAVLASADSYRPAAASPTPSVFHTAVPVRVPVSPEPEPPHETRRNTRLFGRFLLPVDEVEVPDDPDLLPGAARDYRAGVHEGIDFPAPAGTPVRAAAAGKVIRVDRSFVDWTVEQQEIALNEALRLGFTPAATLDRTRGRQVWIDHGGGIVTRYAHLSDVEPLAIGARLEAGTVIGAVGSSGYAQGGPHLHLEVRIGEGYFGEWLTGDELVRACARLFTG